MKTISIYKNGNLDMQIMVNDNEQGKKEIQEWEMLAERLSYDKNTKTKIEIKDEYKKWREENFNDKEFTRKLIEK